MRSWPSLCLRDHKPRSVRRGSHTARIPTDPGVFYRARLEACHASESPRITHRLTPKVTPTTLQGRRISTW
jgi:hypothetical protein